MGRGLCCMFDSCYDDWCSFLWSNGVDGSDDEVLFVISSNCLLRWFDWEVYEFLKGIKVIGIVFSCIFEVL